MTIPSWAEQYVGIPFRPYGRDRSGCDCWGLLRLVLDEQFGIGVPAFSQHSWVSGLGRDEAERQRAGLEALVAANTGPWRAVEPGAERAGQAVLLRQMGRAMHVGVVVDRGWMLHIEEGTNAVLAEYGGLMWRRRIAGFYEWVGA